jgi:hypothetical protein
MADVFIGLSFRSVGSLRPADTVLSGTPSEQTEVVELDLVFLNLLESGEPCSDVARDECPLRVNYDSSPNSTPRLILSGEKFEHGVESHDVRFRAETRDHSDRNFCNYRMDISLVDVGHVHFDVRKGQRSKAVAKCVAVVSESSRVHHDPVESFIGGPIESTDRLTFHVCIENLNVIAVRLRVGAQHGIQLSGGRRSVHLGFAPPQIAQVGALQ